MSHCVFCAIIEGRLPAVKLYEDERVLAFMDIFPLRRGHVLVIPKTHRRQLHELDSSLRSHLVDTATRIAQALHHSALAPAAVHYQVNDGPAANQTVPHVHMHVLPRYHGDTGRFLLRLLRKPLDPALGPAGSATLEADAALIRAGLDSLDSLP